ncbi:hypothetical protein [Hymenobacter sp. IS2118]|uniref:hypothetical protein n=1 Tax=Hymenobacter sp. IS2118 TaxID=1505605 RepID=UPI000557CFFC|nr:hypothetical protein [Hymenobacter sp. IS2118]
MKRLSYFLHLLLLTVLTSASSCDKNSPPPAECPQVRRAPAEFLAYWYFPTGSYWVYHKRGANPAEVDTVTVIGTEVRVFQPGFNTYGLPTCTELYDYALQHSNRRYFPGTSSNNGFRGLESLQTQEEGGQWFVTQESRAANLSPLGFLWSYPQRPVGQPIANQGPILLDTLPVRVPAGTFNRSVHLRIPFLDDSARVDYLYSYHLTRGIGTTRRVYANLGTWELTSYYLAPK